MLIPNFEPKLFEFFRGHAIIPLMVILFYKYTNWLTMKSVSIFIFIVLIKFYSNSNKYKLFDLRTYPYFYVTKGVHKIKSNPSGYLKSLDTHHTQIPFEISGICCQTNTHIHHHLCWWLWPQSNTGQTPSADPYHHQLELLIANANNFHRRLSAQMLITFKRFSIPWPLKRVY